MVKIEKKLHNDIQLFWADEIAENILKEYQKEETIIVKAGASPSGAKHIGNLNDVLRGFFVVEVLKSRGVNVRHIHTCDDRDPLRKIPDKVPDRDGKWHEFSEKEVKYLKKYIGFPYVNIPDPFGCCENWARHFNNVWLDGIKALGVDIENYNNDDLYKEGLFDPIIKEILSKSDESREIISKFQENIPKDYVPFIAICENCGKLTGKIINFNLEENILEYECIDRKLAGEYLIKGCGYKGVTNFRGGKLPWRFEWPAQWKLFNVHFEPFGKDHYEGSWPSGKEICIKILNHKPPLPYVYEFFLVNGEKMSSRLGNVYITQDLLKILEPEVILYFYSKNPEKQRNLDLSNLNLLVDEFDRMEKVFHEEIEPANEREYKLAKRIYPIVMKGRIRKIRIPYTHAATIAQLKMSREQIINALIRSKMVDPNITQEDIDHIIERIEISGEWIRKYASEKYKIKILEKISIKEEEISDNMKVALEELSKYIEIENDGEKIQSKIFSIAKEHEINPSDFFKLIYKLFLGKNEGPRLGPFLAILDKKFVINRLRLIE